MLRILLAIDDYGEMVYLQTLLRKLGFDVDGVQKQRAFVEKQLGFNPQVVVATADGHRLNGIELAEGVRRRQGIPRFILLVHPRKVEELDLNNLKKVDGYVESPVNIEQLLEAISQVADIDVAGLLDKYNQIISSSYLSNESELIILKDRAGSINQKDPPGALSSEAREERFRKYLDDLDEPQADGFNQEKVMEESKEVRRTENKKELRELEEERQGFVKVLFTGGKESKKFS